MPKTTDPKRTERQDYDLAASGISGEWTVLIEETHTGPTKWFVQIEGPSVSFFCELASPSVLETLLSFLEGSNTADAVIGTQQEPITFVRDDEYADRCFVLVGPTERPTVRNSIAGTDLLKLTAALRQARGELKSDGVL